MTQPAPPRPRHPHCHLPKHERNGDLGLLAEAPAGGGGAAAAGDGHADVSADGDPRLHPRAGPLQASGPHHLLPLPHVARRWESIPFLDIGLPACSSSRALWRCAAPINGFRAVRRRLPRHLPRRPLAPRLGAEARSGSSPCASSTTAPPSGSVHRAASSARLSSPAPLSSASTSGAAPCRARRGGGGSRASPTSSRSPSTTSFSRPRAAAAQLEHLIGDGPRCAQLVIRVYHGARRRRPAAARWARGPSGRPNLRNSSSSCRTMKTTAADLLMRFRCWRGAYIAIDILFGTQHLLDGLRRIDKVNKLWFVSLNQSNLLEGITWKFENLMEAQLYTHFGRHSSVLSVVSLLNFATHIERLHIMYHDTEWPEEDEIDEDSLNTEIRGDLFASLKSVVLTDVKYSSNQKCFMKFLLSKARSLQRFDVTFVYDEKRKGSYVNACRKLRECQKASSQVVFGPKFSPDNRQLC